MTSPMTPEQARDAIDATEGTTDYTWPDAHHALETVAGMQEEWGVEYEERRTTKYQPPKKSAGRTWAGDKWIPCDPYWEPRETDWYSREEAERRLGIYSEDRGYPKYRNARLVRRYVTQKIEDEVN